MQIILDISANTHQNDEKYYRRMIETIYALDLPVVTKQDSSVKELTFRFNNIGVQGRKYEIVIKGQLFIRAGKNIHQDFYLFERMANWTYEAYGYKTTASVFDKVSLDLLLLMDIPYELPFIKIANNRRLDYLIGEIPRKIRVYRSIGSRKEAFREEGTTNLLCVSKYPATIEDYESEFVGDLFDPSCISDHTKGLKLWKKYKPHIYECHFVLEHDPNNLDGGEWAKTPEQLKEIMECI